MIRPFGGVHPQIQSSAYVDETAQIIGDVQIGEESSIWCNTVLRGDMYYIRIGNRTNIQDNSVIHVEHDVARVQDLTDVVDLAEEHVRDVRRPTGHGPQNTPARIRDPRAECVRHILVGGREKATDEGAHALVTKILRA